jgi:hypothetical protein
MFAEDDQMLREEDAVAVMRGDPSLPLRQLSHAEPLHDHLRHRARPG